MPAALLVGGLLFAWWEGPASSAPRWPQVNAAGRVELVAGDGDPGDGGKAIEAVVFGVAGMTVDSEGKLYFSDSGHNRVRRIDPRTGTIETVAGNGLVSGGEKSSLARERALREPGPLALDPAGRDLYVGEIAGRRVQRIDLKEGTLHELPVPGGEGFGRIAGLAWTPTGLVVADAERGQLWKLVRNAWIGLLPEGALLRGPGPLARDGMGHLYIGELSGGRILKLDTNSGQVAPYVEDASIRTPGGLAFDPEGNLLVADTGNHRIVRIEAETGKAAAVHRSNHQGGVLDWSPGALAGDREGNLWMGDLHRDRVLLFLAGATQPSVVSGGVGVGDGGPAGEAHLARPGSVAVDRFGNIYISDALHHRVRIVEARTRKIYTLVGTGIPEYNGDGLPGTETGLAFPGQVQVATDGLVYIADSRNHRVRVYDPVTRIVSTFAGNGRAEETGDGGPARDASLLLPQSLYLDGPDTLVVGSGETPTLRRIVLANGRIYRVPIEDPGAPSGRVIQGIGRWNAGLVLAMPRPVPGSIGLLSRNGRLKQLFSAPRVDFPVHVAVSPDEQLFICDTGSNQVLRWTGKEMEVVARGLGRPQAIAFDHRGDLLIADTFNNRVLRVYLHEPPGVIAGLRQAPAARGGAG